MKIKTDEAKFIELLVHAVNKLAGQGRGMSTKINKILYFCDFAHVRKTGDPITGYEYQKLPQGPAPRALVPVRDQLVANGTLSSTATTDEFGYNHHIFSASRPADLSVFNNSERQTIDGVVSKIASMSAREVSDLSHQDAGWQMATVGQSIPFASAYIGEDNAVPDRLLDQLEASAKKITAKLGPRIAG